ncbi:MAG TPA: DUF2726 domain-containing protein [Burkholderiales bacterium]|nr:DUF2726 domain-containing protein [Burkholderiales bacterium]
MKVLGLLLGVVLAGIALVYWYKWYKAVKGEADGLLSKPARQGGAESLEAFIAAYRKGEVSPKDLQAPAGAAAAPVAPPPVKAAAAPAPDAPAPGGKDTFLAGAPKLGYLLCKAALRDHHVFAHVSLRALGGPGLDPGIAQATVDLLVCNARFAPVAAIDVAGPDAGAPDAAKVEALRGLGLRYLRLSAKSLPRPEQLRHLLYRM